jgi:deoxyribodipyrimidine photo-lyase
MMTRQHGTTLVWFRLDLRLADNPALMAAAARGPVAPVFVWAPDEEAPWQPGAASRWWLRHALDALQRELAKKGSRLIVREGPTLDTLRAIAREMGAGAVYWNRRHEPALAARERAVERGLAADGVETRHFNGALLVEPEAIATKDGKPFQVFTPFWNAARQREIDAPCATPARLRAPGEWPASLPLESLRLLPEPDWAGGLRATWTPGAAGARAELGRFLEEAAGDYAEGRDRPAVRGTSRLSPHLHFGEVSPREALQAVQDFAAAEPRAGKGAESFIRQLYWREFAHHLLHHFPHTPDQPLRETFRRFPWRRDAKAMGAWQRGRTGYPLVDAGMRELWQTGWMHNRVRMNAASFLVKHLLLPWQAGARWFWDTLVDADLANNTLGWQWAAGCGADAAPYFRVFNPVLQSRKFDPDGAYLRAYVPEIARLTGAAVHAPWEAGDTGAYPKPVVDHAAARERALAAFETVKRG